MPLPKKKNYHDFRLGTINVRTGKCESKLVECVMHFKKLSHDISCMQEVRQKGEGEIYFDDPVLKGWRVVYNGMKTAKAGVAVTLAPHVRLVDVKHVVEGRMSLVRVKIHGIKLSIFNCYCPTEQYAESTKQAFYQTLHKEIERTKRENPSFKIIVAGDFNATIGVDCEPSNWRCVGQFHDPDLTSFNGSRLVETAEINNLFLLNTMFATKSDEHRWSFVSNLGYKRRLDYIMAEWYVKRATKNCRVYPMQSQPFESDHRIVVMQARFPTKRKSRQIFSSKPTVETKQDIRMLRDDPLVQANYNIKLDQLMKDEPDSQDMDVVEESIIKAIREASKETIPVTEKKKIEKPWLNQEYQQLWKQQCQEKDPVKKRILRDEIKKLRILLKNAYFRTKADNINLASENRNVEEEFRLMKQHTSLERSNMLLVPLSKLEDHFSEHFGPRTYEPQPELEHAEDYTYILPPDELPRINTAVPDIEEIKIEMKRLKNGKCMGTDKIHAEHLKYATSKRLLIYLATLVNLVWTCQQVPTRWLTASITCLYKRGLRSCAENYRGLSIIATLSKIVSAIIVDRLRDAYEYILLPSQFGFRANRSTNDAIFILRHVLEKSKKSKSPLFIAFIDLKAAYDWIPRDALIKCLEIRFKCPQITAILRALYTNTNAFIKGSTKVFDTLVGCRQGAMESPTLFNVYMDFVVRIARREVQKLYPETGFKIKYCIPNEVSTRELRKNARARGENRITELLYADDQAIFAESAEELQTILQIYDHTFTRFGLKMSYSKTETMAFNVDEDVQNKDTLVQVNGTKIKNVRSFRYLGYTVTNICESTKTIGLRIGSAFEKWNELKHVLTDHHIHMSTRVKFLTACVRSRLLYSVQTWQLSCKEQAKIEVVWHGFLRRMVKGGYRREKDDRDEDDNDQGWRFKISNTDLRNITGTKPIKVFCLQQQLKYLAHICRMGNDDLRKQTLFDENSFRWTKLEKELGLETQQIRRMMMNKSSLQCLLDLVDTPSGR